MEESTINADPAPRRLSTRILAALKQISIMILRQWLIIGMGIACGLAYLFPDIAKTDGGVIRSEYTVLYGVIAIIFLISGLNIPRQKLFKQFLNWRLHILVQVISFLFIPAVVIAVVHIILAADPAGHIDRAVLAGYILTACIPTTIASNVVMTRAAGGDDAAALVEVLLANVLGPFVTAVWTVTLLPKSAEFDPWRYGGGSLGVMYKHVFQQLGLSVLLPLFVGQLIRWTWPERTAWVMQKTRLPKLSSACMLLLIWLVLHLSDKHSQCFEYPPARPKKFTIYQDDHTNKYLQDNILLLLRNRRPSNPFRPKHHLHRPLQHSPLRRPNSNILLQLTASKIPPQPLLVPARAEMPAPGGNHRSLLLLPGEKHCARPAAAVCHVGAGGFVYQGEDVGACVIVYDGADLCGAVFCAVVSEVACAGG